MKQNSESYIFKFYSSSITVSQRLLAEKLSMGDSTFRAGRGIVAMVCKATKFAHCGVVGDDRNQSHSHPNS
jgi:hypothetical protein